MVHQQVVYSTQAEASLLARHLNASTEVQRHGSILSVLASSAMLFKSPTLMHCHACLLLSMQRTRV